MGVGSKPSTHAEHTRSCAVALNRFASGGHGHASENSIALPHPKPEKQEQARTLNPRLRNSISFISLGEKYSLLVLLAGQRRRK